MALGSLLVRIAVFASWVAAAWAHAVRGAAEAAAVAAAEYPMREVGHARGAGCSSTASSLAFPMLSRGGAK